MELRELLPVAISLAVLGLTIAYVLNVNADVAADMACPSSTATHTYYNASAGVCCTSEAVGCNAGNRSALSLEGNASSDVSVGLAKIPAKLPLLVGVVVAVAVLTLLIRGLGGLSRG